MVRCGDTDKVRVIIKQKETTGEGREKQRCGCLVKNGWLVPLSHGTRFPRQACGKEKEGERNGD